MKNCRGKKGNLIIIFIIFIIIIRFAIYML